MHKHRYNLHKRTQTVMRNLAKSRGKEYNKVFLPKPLSPMNAPSSSKKSLRKCRKRKLLSKPAVRDNAKSPPDAARPHASAAPSSSAKSAYDVSEISQLSQDPFGQMMFAEYSLVDEDVLVHLVHSDDEDDADANHPPSTATTPRTATTPPPSSPPPQMYTPPDSFPDSFPSSPAPSVPPTPSLTPVPTYPDEFTPRERNYAGDYEAVMTAISDLNSFARILRRGTGVLGTDTYTRDDILPVLSELYEMLKRMFTRLEQQDA